MTIKYLIIFLISFSVGRVFIFLLKKFSLRYNLLTSKGMPLIGGLSMGLSFILACLFDSFLYGGLSSEIKGILFASGIMLIFGVIDDWRELSITAKFLVQLIATTLLILFGIRTQIIYIGNPFNIIITFVWILGITNAFNLLDVIDGLAASTAVIVSSAFLVIALLNNDIKTAILTLSLLGTLFSFLIYNFPPAKIYMGNSGSHFLGFTLAALALLISYAPLERKVALLSPLLILGFPMFDTAFLVLVRMKKKRLPFKKSNDHLALRFLTLGYSKRKALLVMSALCLFFSLCGIAVSQAFNVLGIIITAFVVLTSLIVTYWMSKVVVNG